MSLLQISLDRLRNEQHVQFMTGVKELLAAEELESLKLDALFPLFTQALANEGEVVELVRKLGVNELLRQHNNARTTAYRSLLLAVKPYLLGEVYADKKTAAQKVHALIAHYKNLSVRGATERIASYTKFLKDLREQCSAEIALLGLDTWLTPLEAANKKVERLWYERAEIKGEHRQSLRMMGARKAVDLVYRRMMAQLNILLLLDAQPYDAIVKKLNGHLTTFKTVLVHRKTLKKKADARVSEEVATESGIL